MFTLLRRHLRMCGPHIVGREMKRSVTKALTDLRSPMNTIVRLASARPSGGSALLAYKLEPFVLPREQQPAWHVQYWVTEQMARTLLELGYDVDVVHQSNGRYWPLKRYSIVIDVRHVLQRIASTLDADCIKIVHLDTAHLNFHNAAEGRRLLALQRRRGVTLPASRFTPPNFGLEHADCATTFGNDFTASTFRYAGKPIHRLPVPSSITCPWPATKNFDNARRRFLFFASHGLVHKGLDLVLEAFAQVPEVQLVVCGPVDEEREFVKAYHKELYETGNIETIGWVTTTSQRFIEIANGCGTMILPSCSEGGPASPIECMHAGLIPIVTMESSTDVEDFGVLLKQASVDEIAAEISRVASLSPAELRQRARAAWEYARAQHTRERFSLEYRRTLETILGAFGARRAGA